MNRANILTFCLFLVILLSAWDRHQTEKHHRVELRTQSISHLTANAYNNANRTLMLLAQLQRGDTNGTFATLENDLAQDVNMLLHYHLEQRPRGWDDHEVNLLEKVRDYQPQYPGTLTPYQKASTEALLWPRRPKPVQ